MLEFNLTSFDTIRLCNLDTTICYVHTLSQRYNSPRELFSSGYISDTSFDQDSFDAVFGLTTKMDCMFQVGFNVQCDSSNRARMGYCNDGIGGNHCPTGDT
eukprot:UN05747